DDVLRLGLRGGELGELERIAAMIGEFHDALALVVVTEDHDATAEAALGRPGALTDLVGRERRVFGERARARCHRCRELAHHVPTSLRPYSISLCNDWRCSNPPSSGCQWATSFSPSFQHRNTSRSPARA